MQSIKYVATKLQRAGPCEAVKVTETGEEVPLDPRFDLRRHSPTGFSFGYSGSGPAQLSLAILADATGDDRVAGALYQEFKRKFVAAAAGDRLELTKEEIDRWVEEKAKSLDLSDWEADEPE